MFPRARALWQCDGCVVHQCIVEGLQYHRQLRGQRQWFKDLDVKMGIGLVSINGVPLLMGGTPERIKQLCQRFAIISPGLTKKDRLANRIYKNTGLMTDDILSILPGASEIIEDNGIFSPVKIKKLDEEE